jgi:phage/plasmid-associated DNA primase
MDMVGRFLSERCEPVGEIQATTLYQAFRDWCEHGGEYLISQRVFGEKLSGHGFEKGRLPGKGHIFWKEIQLICEPREGSFTPLNTNGHAV